MRKFSILLNYSLWLCSRKFCQQFNRDFAKSKTCLLGGRREPAQSVENFLSSPEVIYRYLQSCSPSKVLVGLVFRLLGRLPQQGTTLGRARLPAKQQSLPEIPSIAHRFLGSPDNCFLRLVGVTFRSCAKIRQIAPLHLLWLPTNEFVGRTVISQFPRAKPPQTTHHLLVHPLCAEAVKPEIPYSRTGIIYLPFWVFYYRWYFTVSHLESLGSVRSPPGVA